MKRKYPKTTGYYVYVHITPEMDCYFGKSKQEPCNRFAPSQYKDCSLYPYIEQFGWDGIEHRVLFDNLTARQAEVLEDWFIKNAKRDGFCINDRRSGGIKRDNPEAYRQTKKLKAYRREYYHNRYHNDTDFKERERERGHQYYLKKKLNKNQ